MKKIIRNRVLSWLLATVMAATSVFGSAAVVFADETQEVVDAVEAVVEESDLEAEETNDAAEAVKIEAEDTEETVKAEEAASVTYAEVTVLAQASCYYITGVTSLNVASNLAESYGYTDTIKDGVSALDAAVAYHQFVFGEDYTADTKDAYLSLSSSGWVTTLLGDDGSSSGFFVNKGYPNDGTEAEWGGYNGTFLNSTELSDGDVLDIYFNDPDSYWCDYFSFIDVPEAVYAGEEFEVTVSGVMAMMGYEYATPEALRAGAEPLEGAMLKWIDLETLDEMEIPDVVTDENGVAAITAPEEAGVYTLVAVSNADEDVYVFMNPAEVNVVEKEIVEDAVIKSVKEDGSNYAMFPLTSYEVSVNLDGTYHVTINNGSKKTYSGFYWGPTSDEDKTLDVEGALNEAGEMVFDFDLAAEDFGKYYPVTYWNSSKSNWVATTYYLGFALDAETKIAPVCGEDVTVTVVKSLAGDVDSYSCFDITVSADCAESYGYIDGSAAVVLPVSALDALVAAHAAEYGDAFGADTAANYLVANNGWVTKIYGIATSANGFLVNEGTPNDGTESEWGGYNGTTVTTTVVNNGDVLTFFTYEDTSFWSDVYPFVTAPETAIASDTMDVNVVGTSVMMGYLYKTPEDFKAAAEPVEGAVFTWINAETGEKLDVETETDEDGNAVVAVPDSVGMYYFAAVSGEDVSLVVSPVVITVRNMTADELAEAVDALGDITLDDKAEIERLKKLAENVENVPEVVAQKLVNAELKLENLENKATIEDLEQKLEDLSESNKQLENTINNLILLLATPDQAKIKVTKTLDTSVGAVITWTAADKADAYEVYRRVDEEGEFELIGTTKELKYTDDKAVNTNVIYEYRVVSTKTVGSDVYKAEPSAIKYAACIEAPKLVSVENTADGPKLTWGGVDNVDGFLVFRKDPGAEKYGKPVSNISGDRTSTVNKSGANFEGQTIRYRVAAFKYYNGEKIQSAKSNYIKITVK